MALWLAMLLPCSLLATERWQSDDYLIQSFMEVAMKREYGHEAQVRFSRWQGPIRLKLINEFGDKPLQAALKLNETTNFLTQRTYEQIKALTEQGRTTDAARVAQEAYATAIESRTPQLAGALGYVERAWLSIKNATKGAFDAALNIGRGNTLDGQIEALRQRIESAQTSIYSRDKVPELRQELALLQEQQRIDRKSVV